MSDDYCSDSSRRRSRGVQQCGARLRALSLCLLAVLQNTVVAQPAHRPHMTGQQLIRDMKADPRIGHNAVQRERAMGYLDGVMDAGAGKVWCPAGKDIPHELHYEVTDDVALLGPEKLKRDGATLVLTTLAAPYPFKPFGMHAFEQTFQTCSQNFPRIGSRAELYAPPAGMTSLR